MSESGDDPSDPTGDTPVTHLTLRELIWGPRRPNPSASPHDRDVRSADSAPSVRGSGASEDGAPAATAPAGWPSIIPSPSVSPVPAGRSDGRGLPLPAWFGIGVASLLTWPVIAVFIAVSLVGAFWESDSELVFVPVFTLPFVPLIVPIWIGQRLASVGWRWMGSILSTASILIPGILVAWATSG